jgi:hypothetical protein
MVFALLLLAGAATAAGVKDKPKPKPEPEAKELSGISIVGNKEAPKSLFIVPWKSSELGVETSLSSRLLNEKLQAVDKDVFERELDFYSVTTNGK